MIKYYFGRDQKKLGNETIKRTKIWVQTADGVVALNSPNHFDNFKNEIEIIMQQRKKRNILFQKFE